MEQQSGQPLSSDGIDEANSENEHRDKALEEKSSKIDALTELSRRDPALVARFAMSLDTVMDKAYDEGFEDGFIEAHFPVDNHCVVCGSLMSDEESRYRQ